MLTKMIHKYTTIPCSQINVARIAERPRPAVHVYGPDNKLINSAGRELGQGAGHGQG